MCISCCVLLRVRVYHIRGGRVAYLLPLALVSPGFCSSTVVDLVGLDAVLPLPCALPSRPWGRLAMWKSCVTQGRRRWCAASCHVVAGCVMLFLENVAVGCVALRRLTCCCVVLRRIVFGSCGVVSLCCCVLSRRVLCFVVWRWVVSCCAGSCHVALCVVLRQFVVWCSIVLCSVVLCGCSLGCGVPCFVTLSCIACCCRVSPCGVLCSCYIVWCGMLVVFVLSRCFVACVVVVCCLAACCFVGMLVVHHCYVVWRRVTLCGAVFCRGVVWLFHCVLALRVLCRRRCYQKAKSRDVYPRVQVNGLGCVCCVRAVCKFVVA